MNPSRGVTTPRDESVVKRDHRPVACDTSASSRDNRQIARDSRSGGRDRRTVARDRQAVRRDKRVVRRDERAVGWPRASPNPAGAAERGIAAQKQREGAVPVAVRRAGAGRVAAAAGLCGGRAAQLPEAPALAVLGREGRAPGAAGRVARVLAARDRGPTACWPGRRCGWPPGRRSRSNACSRVTAWRRLMWRAWIAMFRDGRSTSGYASGSRPCSRR